MHSIKCWDFRKRHTKKTDDLYFVDLLICILVILLIQKMNWYWIRDIKCMKFICDIIGAVDEWMIDFVNKMNCSAQLKWLYTSIIYTKEFSLLNTNNLNHVLSLIKCHKWNNQSYFGIYTADKSMASCILCISHSRFEWLNHILFYLIYEFGIQIRYRQVCIS